MKTCTVRNANTHTLLLYYHFCIQKTWRMWMINDKIIKFSFLFFFFLAAQKCSFPGAPAHSTVTFTDETLDNGAVAQYSCERGFELLGPSRRVCDHGAWVPEGVPFCGEYNIHVCVFILFWWISDTLLVVINKKCFHFRFKNLQMHFAIMLCIARRRSLSYININMIKK